MFKAAEAELIAAIGGAFGAGVKANIGRITIAKFDPDIGATFSFMVKASKAAKALTAAALKTSFGAAIDASASLKAMVDASAKADLAVEGRYTHHAQYPLNRSRTVGPIIYFISYIILCPSS